MVDNKSWKMEVTDSTRILLNRIQKLEPENATKIIGYLLLKHTNQEIMECAFWSDKQILSLVDEAKSYLASSPKANFSTPIPQVRDHRVQNMPFSPTISRPLSSPLSFRVPAPFWDPPPASDQIPLRHNLDFSPSSYVDLIGGLHKQADYSTLEEQLSSLNVMGPGFTNNCYVQEAPIAGEFGSRTSSRSHPGWMDSPTKACHYYYKGFCKHGVNCRFFHGQEINDGFLNVCNSYANDLCSDDIPFSPGSLEKLEIEIIELLKSKKGLPVSIASLPMMYLERYGKVLQADGYLTESQRHGKSGFSLTRLLAKYNSLLLIDRPHGQHSVVLVEDAPKFMDYRNERTDQGYMRASSHQIYLTFPAESTFMEDDVYNYFNQYGPVHDVRIPRQEKRMFGFVSFLYPETVKLILSMGHPHYICGARVLVKPYKEKSKLTEKKYAENDESPVFYPSQYLEMDQNPNTMLNMNDNSTFMKRQLIDDLDLAIELERRRLFDLQLIPKQKTLPPYLNIVTDNLKFPEDDFNKLLAVSNNDSKSDIVGMQASNNHSHQHSDHVELPDSPFATPQIGNNISGTKGSNTNI